MPLEASRNPRHVHVLFVHGVGTHSHLSSLLQAFQALRSNIRSPEVPGEGENPFPDWRLTEVDTSVPRLKLEPLAAGPDDTKAVYFYEVNYSALAGVVRVNHPIDVTGLFVGFDLAINVSRQRLRGNPPDGAKAGSFSLDHIYIAGILQKIATVFVAATVPILGIPSLIFRAYTKSYVATFTRFFEDIATFALDRNGEELISRHVDRTIERIHVDDERFHYAEDEFIIAAHSLGTIVTHNYLVRRPDMRPNRLLTFGSPIGLICWTWLLLDFPKMKFDPELEFNAPHEPYDPNKRDDKYFSWDVLESPGRPGAAVPLQWINVVNHLDPIATAFPVDYVNLARPPAEVAASLSDARIHHRFIKTGGVFSAGGSHTQYFESKEFREILSRMAGLRLEEPEEVGKAPRNEDWSLMARHLRWIEDVMWLAGVLAIVAYLGIVGSVYKSWTPYLFLLYFLWTPLVIGTLAFFQRLFFGWPTKRTAGRRIDSLPRSDWAAFPYRLRRKVLWFWEPNPRETKSSIFKKIVAWICSFIPSAVLMVAPALAAYCHTKLSQDPFELIWANKGKSLGMLALFMVYVVAFAISEFAKHWRIALIWCTNRTSSR